MKLRLLEYLRCPGCRGFLQLEGTPRDRVDVSDEVMSGRLRCAACGRQFPVRDGIPRLLVHDRAPMDPATARTSSSFGYLWTVSGTRATESRRSYHFDKMAQALELPRSTGLVLDAGCGEGIDLANQAGDAEVEVIGVELSDGGCATSFARVARLPLAHVVQADLRQLPFDNATFDHVYSYGVLHHVSSPSAAAAELARVVRPGSDVAVYLYEDFSERSIGWRWALRAVNSLRAVTTALPPRLLYRLSQAVSPVVYVAFTLPHLLLKRIPWTRKFAFSLPYRHGQGPFALAGDLYDRFSAPVEFRYSRRGAGDLLANAGLQVTKVEYERGWMVLARASVK